MFDEFDAFGDELDAIWAGKVDPTQFGSKHGLCRFNTSVNCKESNCARCGWNPAVDKARRIKTVERLAMEKYVEQ